MTERVRVATRGSTLALAQTGIVVDLLKQKGPMLDIQIVRVKTTGDILPPDRLGQVDGKSAFTSEIERCLVEDEADVAVHSYKDLPAEVDERLTVAATPARGDARDALVSAQGLGLRELGPHPRIGTSSVRRKAQLMVLRKDAEVVEMHGNVETRLRRMKEIRLDGVVLAAAGLVRLGLSSQITQFFEVDEVVPAVCQGTIAVEARKDDRDILKLLQSVNDERTNRESLCERSFSRRLGGDCNVPLGAYAWEAGESMTVTGVVAKVDGSKSARHKMTGPRVDPATLGEKLADRLMELGGDEILAGMAR